MRHTELAPAKLTLSLRVTGLRHDGYHLIDAEMVSVDLYDTLTFDEGDALTLTGISIPGSERPADNLVSKALRAVDRRAAVILDKQIPAGGGLGGGSSDAAAVLRWAGVTDDVDLAASLGGDVPFCVHGGRSRVTGIGDELTPLPYVESTYTLLTPPLHVSTPAVYRAWDDLGGPTGNSPNDLEAAALSVCPQLAQWRDRFGNETGATPVLAGSGATWFVPGSFREAGRVVTTLPASKSS